MKPLSPARVAARALGARIFAATSRALTAQGDDGGSIRAIAKRVGLSHQQVDRCADEKSGDGVHLDTILAAGPRFAAEFFRLALAEVEGANVPTNIDPGQLALQLASRVGRLATKQQEFIADKHYSRPEWRELAALFAAIESVARIGRLASERAAGGGQ